MSDVELINDLKSMSEYEGEKPVAKVSTADPQGQDDEDEEDDGVQTQEQESEVDELDEENQDQENEEDADDILQKTVKVKVGDEEKDVTVDELTKGYMRQSDYTKKTQEAADVKKAYYDGAVYLKQVVDFVSENLDKSALVSEEKRLEEALNEVDPSDLNADELITYQRIKAKYEKLHRENEAKRQELTQLKELQKEEQKKFLETFRKEEAKKIAQAIPEYADSKKKAADQERMSRYIEAVYGDQAKTVADKVIDHRDYLNFRYAAIGYEYVNGKKPDKVIKQIKPLRNGGGRTDLRVPGQDGGTDKVLKQVKARGDRAAASPEEIQAILMKRLS